MSGVTIALVAFTAGTMLEPLIRATGIWNGIWHGSRDSGRPGWWIWRERVEKEWKPAPWNKDPRQ